MNEQLVQRVAAPAPAPIKARPDLVRAVMAHYARPMRMLRRYRAFDEWLPVQDLPAENPSEHDRKIATERWKFIPDFRGLLDAIDAFRAVFNETDEANIRVLVGLMLDGLPSAKTLPSASYTDALVFVLCDPEDDEHQSPGSECFSALVIAAAVVEVWRSATFAPSLAEFLTIAKKKRLQFHRAYQIANRLYDLRCQAEDVLLIFGDIEPEPRGEEDDIPF
jgi:hypothetical protein